VPLRRSLIRRAAWLGAIEDGHELRLARSEKLDVGAHTLA
jgi:hypothetical protein